MYIIIYHYAAGNRWYFNGFKAQSASIKTDWKPADNPDVPIQIVTFKTKEAALDSIKDIRKVDGQDVANSCAVHFITSNPVT
jgi:hypothetical protein